MFKNRKIVYPYGEAKGDENAEVYDGFYLLHERLPDFDHRLAALRSDPKSGIGPGDWASPYDLGLHAYVISIPTYDRTAHHFVVVFATDKKQAISIFQRLLMSWRGIEEDYQYDPTVYATSWFHGAVIQVEEDLDCAATAQAMEDFLQQFVENGEGI